MDSSECRARALMLPTAHDEPTKSSLSLAAYPNPHASPLAQRARKAETGPDAVLRLAQRTQPTPAALALLDTSALPASSFAEFEECSHPGAINPTATCPHIS